jgi:hypothetical protein
MKMANRASADIKYLRRELKKMILTCKACLFVLSRHGIVIPPTQDPVKVARLPRKHNTRKSSPPEPVPQQQRRKSIEELEAESEERKLQYQRGEITRDQLLNPTRRDSKRRLGQRKETSYK